MANDELELVGGFHTEVVVLVFGFQADEIVVVVVVKVGLRDRALENY